MPPLFFYSKTCQLLANNMLIMISIILYSLPVSNNMLKGNNPRQAWLVVMYFSESLGDTSPDGSHWDDVPAVTLQTA